MNGVGERPTRTLARAFVQLANGLANGNEVAELFEHLVISCADLFGAAAAGVMLADQGGRLHAMAVAPVDRDTFELLALQQNEGPCLDCYRTRRTVRAVGQAEMAARWPNFTRALPGRGYGSVYAVPLRLRDVTIGALSLYRMPGSPMSEDNLEIAQALADVLTVAVLQHYALRAAGASYAKFDTEGAFELVRGYARSIRYRLPDSGAAPTVFPTATP